MNKIAVISGGSRGIGKSVVMKFAEHGFDIITCSRSLPSLKRVSEEVHREYPESTCHFFQADLSVKKEVLLFVDFIKSKSKQVEVLVNNTGVFIPGEIHKEEDGVLEKMIDTNLYSAYHLSRGIVPMMISRKSGHIFNMCSTASIMAYPNGGSYCISKFALYGMSKVLREELKKFGIKVTSVLPGAVLTESWKGTDLPADRFISPEDVAEAIFNSYTLSKSTLIEEILIRPQAGDV